jgi:hypothetical protein
MSDKGVTMTLEPSEERLIKALRYLPESRLRDRVHRFMDELTVFIQHPRCGETQADGVPCQNAETDCDQCAHLSDMLEQIVRRAGA